MIQLPDPILPIFTIIGTSEEDLRHPHEKAENTLCHKAHRELIRRL